MIPDFAALLAVPTDPATTARIERVPTIGRTTAWGAGMDHGARAAAWPPLAPGNPAPKPRMDRDTKREPRLP